MKPVMRLVCIVLLLLSPLVARSVEAPEPPTAMIPPGHDELFAAMLGMGTALPAGCAFVSGGIDRAVARGTYRCAGDEVVIELRHPSAAPGAAGHTEKIAIVTVHGTPPPALLTALEGRIRERERGFEWVWPEPKQDVVRPEPDESSTAGRQVGPHTSAACGLPPGQGNISPYVPTCYPRFVGLLVGTAQTLVILLGLGCGLVRLYRTPSL